MLITKTKCFDEPGSDALVEHCMQKIYVSVVRRLISIDFSSGACLLRVTFTSLHLKMCRIQSLFLFMLLN